MARKKKNVELTQIMASAVAEAAEQLKKDLTDYECEENSDVKATDVEEMAILSDFDEKADQVEEEKEEDLSQPIVEDEPVNSEQEALPEPTDEGETSDTSEIAEEETKEELEDIDDTINYNFIGIDMKISRDESGAISATFTKDDYTTTVELSDPSFTGIMKEIENFLVEYHDNSSVDQEEDFNEPEEDSVDNLENSDEPANDDTDDEDKTLAESKQLLASCYKANKKKFMEYAMLGYAFKKHILETGEKVIFEDDIKSYMNKSKDLDKKIVEASEQLKKITEKDYKQAKLANIEYKEKYSILSGILNNAKTALTSGKIETEKIKLVLSNVAKGFDLPKDKFAILANKAQDAIKFAAISGTTHATKKINDKNEINLGNEADDKVVMASAVVNGGFGTKIGGLNKKGTEYDEMLIDIKRISGIN